MPRTLDSGLLTEIPESIFKGTWQLSGVGDISPLIETGHTSHDLPHTTHDTTLGALPVAWFVSSGNQFKLLEGMVALLTHIVI